MLKPMERPGFCDTGVRVATKVTKHTTLSDSFVVFVSSVLLETPCSFISAT